MLPGVHRVRKPRADGGVTEYWYAYRGGPQILKASARSDALLQREIAKLTPAAIKASGAQQDRTDDKTMYGLISQYLDSPAFKKDLAPRTQRDRRKFLEIGRKAHGMVLLRDLKASNSRHMFLTWRKQFEHHPKTADELLSALSVAMAWGVDNELCTVNPLKDFPRIYSVDRADIIWEPEHLAALYPHCSAELNYAVRLAALTGARKGDLIELGWGNVTEHAIIYRTNKSNRKRTVVVPIYPALRTLLEEIPRGESLTLLNSSLGRPWSDAGLGTAFRLAKAAAGITGRRWHDLRGTAATNFKRAGLEDEDIATILGWAIAQVKAIIIRYVTAEAIGMALVEKLRRNAAGTVTVNHE